MGQQTKSLRHCEVNLKEDYELGTSSVGNFAALFTGFTNESIENGNATRALGEAVKKEAAEKNIPCEHTSLYAEWQRSGSQGYDLDTWLLTWDIDYKEVEAWIEPGNRLAV